MLTNENKAKDAILYPENAKRIFGNENFRIILFYKGKARPMIRIMHIIIEI